MKTWHTILLCKKSTKRLNRGLWVQISICWMRCCRRLKLSLWRWSSTWRIQKLLMKACNAKLSFKKTSTRRLKKAKRLYMRDLPTMAFPKKTLTRNLSHFRTWLHSSRIRERSFLRSLNTLSVDHPIRWSCWINHILRLMKYQRSRHLTGKREAL